MKHRSGRIGSLERVANSPDGNPRWAISLVDAEGAHLGSWNTTADASFNYELGNRGKRQNDWVVLTIGARGTITGITEYLP